MFAKLFGEAIEQGVLRESGVIVLNRGHLLPFYILKSDEKSILFKETRLFSQGGWILFKFSLEIVHDWNESSWY